MLFSRPLLFLDPVRNPDLFLVHSVNALTPFAWRPSGTAFSLQAFARTNTNARAYVLGRSEYTSEMARRATVHGVN